MRRAVVLLLLACHREPPVWPADLTEGWKHLELTRDTRHVAVEKRGELWRLLPPRNGDADPDTIDRLALALKRPQVLVARPVPQTALMPVTWELTVDRWHLTASRTGLGNPVLVRIDGVGEFTISPVELGNQVPDPEELLTPGLWVAAKNSARTFTLLEGPHPYALKGHGEDWELADGGAATRELDDLPGIVVGRQAIGHPTATLKELGLDPPLARAQLCTSSGECREFIFGKAGEHHYAKSPDSDPIELRQSDWSLVVNGP